MYSYLKNVFWLPQPNKVELHFSADIPDLEKVAAVFVYVFNDSGQLLLVQEHKGTWDIPGGGREAGETIEQTATRETMEEACVKIKDIKIIGYQRLLVSAEKPANYKRPYPESYEVFVMAHADNEHPFIASGEAINRKFPPPKEAVKEDGLRFENRHVIFDKALTCKTN